MKRFARALVVLLIVILLVGSLVGCATQYGRDGALLGGGVGAIAGAVIDGRNPWRGAIIGGGLGAILGGGMGEIAAQASRDAAYSDRPVRRPLRDGYYVESRRHGYDRHRPRCAHVQERIFDAYGELQQENWRTICP